jgi:ribosomal protein S18 acetylase RimI-like enzyme
VSVRVSDGAEAARVAHLHVEGLPDSLLAGLGPRFLTRLYLRIAQDPGSFLLVREHGGEVAGFVAGTVNTGALYRSFLRHDGLGAALSASGHLLRHGRRAWDTLRYGRGAGDPSDPPAELLSLAVAADARRLGIGGQLVDAFVAELDRRGISTCRVTVGASNAAARALYAGAGFQDARTIEVHRGDPSVVMIRP